MEPENSLPHSQKHVTCSCLEPDQSSPCQTPHPISWRPTLILFSHLHLHLPSGLIHSGLPTKIQHTPSLAQVPATCPAHLTVLDLIAWIKSGEEYRSCSASSFNFLHSLVSSSFLDRNLFLGTLFSHTLSLCSSLVVTDQISHSYTKQQAKL